MSGPLDRLAADVLADGMSAFFGADLSQLVMELQMEEAGYQAVLGATDRLCLPSLTDFLAR